jgi:hypothetical protein
MTIEQLKDKLSDLLEDAYSSEEEISKVRSELESALGKSSAEPARESDASNATCAQNQIAPVKIEILTESLSREDFEKVEAIARNLGIDATRSGGLFSRLEIAAKEQANTPLGMFALRILIENQYLKDSLTQIANIASGAVMQLNLINNPPAEPKSRKSKNQGEK